jgi:hypothetical protein
VNERQTHRMQHFAPRFYLHGWYAPGTTFLFQFSKLSNKWDGPKSVGTKGTGFQEHLYSLIMPDGKYDTSVEQYFFGLEIDEPAHPFLRQYGRQQAVSI